MQVLLLTFANNRTEPLATLTEEYLHLNRTLTPRAFRQHYLMHPLSHATKEEIAYYLTLFREQLSLFLFSGHAGRDVLLTEDGASRAEGIAHLLGQCTNLQVVILNGCSTIGQVTQLHEAGVPLVIATHAPVNDKLATEFSKKLFEALEANCTIATAFEQGVGLVLTQRKIEVYRSVVPRKKSRNNDMLWGIFPNLTKNNLAKNNLTKKSAEHWQLANQAIHSVPSHYVENELLLDTLFETFAKSNDTIDELYESGANFEEDTERITHALLSALPAPISEHVRKLVLPPLKEGALTYSRVSSMRLQQLIQTYQICMDFMAFVLLAQVWENQLIAQHSPTTQQAWQSELQNFLDSDIEERKYTDYYSIIRLLREALAHHQVVPFIEELDELRSEFMENEAVKNACFFLETLRRQLDQAPAREMTELCARAEESLATIFSKLGFLGNYLLATVRNIDVMKYRHTKDAIFNHLVVKWHGTLGIYNKEYRKQPDFMDNRSVVLLRLKTKQKATPAGQSPATENEFLNLSPFILDENTFERVPDTSLSKLYFLAGHNPETGQLFYKYVNDPEVDIIDLDDKEFYDRRKKSSKFQLAKEQFEAFYQAIFYPIIATS